MYDFIFFARLADDDWEKKQIIRGLFSLRRERALVTMRKINQARGIGGKEGGREKIGKLIELADRMREKKRK